MPRRRRASGRRRLRAAALLAALTLGAAACGLVDDDAADDDADGVAASGTADLSSLRTAVATTKDLVEEIELDGTLGFGTPTALPNLLAGVVTSLPDAGDVVEFGRPLYEIDGMAVVLLPGDTPAHRTLRHGVDPGGDVVRLEKALERFGYAETADVTVDDEFTSATAEAVRLWQADLGLPETGVVELGRVVFGPLPVRISAVSVGLGRQVNGGSVVSYTGTQRHVQVNLDTALAGLLAAGDTVSVELPDESVVDGTVTSVSKVAVTAGDGPQQSSFLPVEIVLSGSGGEFDESPVTVRVEDVLERDALVVPIPALLALAEGGYAVEVLETDGAGAAEVGLAEVRLVGVTLGTFHRNEVSIGGGRVLPGDQVVIP